jgi:threonine dehydratase
VLACEPETGAPFAASYAAGTPVEVDYTPSFVDGAGSKLLLGPMWDRAHSLLSGGIALTLDETAGAVRTLAERARVIAEGAGALAVAAALSGRAGEGRIVCIVSGGNIDAARLAAILEGRTPA